MDEANIREIARGPGGEFLAWFAGFWEGEGWLQVKPRFTRLAISQIDRKPLDLIQAKFGGKVTLRPKRENSGPTRINSGPIWVWQLHERRKVIEVLSRVIPFLKFKQQKVIEKLKEIEDLERNSPFHPWNQNEEDFVKANWQKLTDLEIAQKLKLSRHAVAGRRKKLGIFKPSPVKPGPGEYWTQEEDEFIKQNWASMEDSKIAQTLKRSPDSVKYRRLYKLGIPKRGFNYGG